MTWDHPDRQKGGLSMDISDKRIERVFESVMARLDSVPQSPPSPWMRLRTALSGLTENGLLPAPRFAMPMAAAAILGVFVGRQMEAAETAAQLANLITHTTIYTSGF